MTREDILRMAREAQLPYYFRTGEVVNLDKLERFAALVAASEREMVAQWMMRLGYATGHGDSIADLLTELEWQIREQERNACAQMVEPVDESLADEIRARGEK